MKYIHGGDIYSYSDILDFSANINPLGLDSSIADAICRSVNEAVNYPDAQCRRLRKKIARYEGVFEDAVVCGNGAAELIFNIVFAIKPKMTLLTAPSFAEYERAARAAGSEIKYYYTNESTGYKIGFDYLDSITDDTDILFLCNPENPTGTFIEPELLARIIQKTADMNITAVIDECFLNFTDSFHKGSMIKNLGRYKNLIVLKAFTKMYALPGIRIGYALTYNKEVIDKIYSVRQPGSVSVTAQAAGEAALDKTEIEAAARKYIKQECDFLCREFDRLGIDYIKPEANYIFFSNKTGLKERLIKENILIRDCSDYVGLTEGKYRIAVKRHQDNIRLIAALEKIMGE